MVVVLDHKEAQSLSQAGRKGFCRPLEILALILVREPEDWVDWNWRGFAVAAVALQADLELELELELDMGLEV